MKSFGIVLLCMAVLDGFAFWAQAQQSGSATTQFSQVQRVNEPSIENRAVLAAWIESHCVVAIPEHDVQWATPIAGTWKLRCMP